MMQVNKKKPVRLELKDVISNLYRMYNEYTFERDTSQEKRILQRRRSSEQTFLCNTKIDKVAQSFV